MKDLLKKQFGIILVLTLVLVFQFNLKHINAAERISGADRFETAVKVSQKGWRTSNVVVLAQGWNFPDALAGVPLATKLNSPILLTESNKLPTTTIQEIKRLKASKVIILGGTSAISKSIEDRLRKELQVSISRYGGADRFETAEIIAQQLKPYTEAIIVNAYNYPDALSIAPYAGQKGAPILLSSMDAISINTKNAASLAQHVYVIGGSAAISENVNSEIGGERISGVDRFETSAEVINKLGISFNQVYFVTGNQFADALAGGVLAAKNNCVIALVSKYNVTSNITDIFSEKMLSNVGVIGGEQAISPMAYTKIDEATYEEAEVNKSKQIIMYIPHPDDEVLTMGTAINYFKDHGYDIKLVLLSKGKESQVYQKLKIEFSDLTLEEFGESRVREFKDSATKLGIQESNIYINDLPDNSISYEQVYEIILNMKALFPNAEHQTYTYYDAHRDHATAGKVLNDLTNEGILANSKFYISFYDFDKHKGIYYPIYDKTRILNSLEAYKLFDPAVGRYGIGYSSVPQWFNHVALHPQSKFHFANH